MISVIVPVYNIEKYLPRAIDSILNQTIQNIEVILVNDGSTDLSGELCERYAEADKRVKAIHKENGGIASARNYGLDTAKGDFICFIDGDDWVESKMLAELLEPMLLDQSIEICIGTHVLEGATGSLNAVFKEKAAESIYQPEICRQMLERIYWGWELCGKLYRKEMFYNVRCNEKIVLGEDLNTNWHIFQGAKKVYYRATKRYHYCMRAMSVTHEPFSERALTLVDTLNEIDAAINEDLVLKAVNRVRLLHHCMEFTTKMFLLDADKYRDKIISYQQVLVEKFEHTLETLNISKIKKMQAKILMSSFDACKYHFEQEYQTIAEILKAFSLQYNQVYIYGAGNIGLEAAQIMRKENITFSGFVVSNKKEGDISPDEYYPLLQFSDLQFGEGQNVGIILAMKKKNIEDVAKNFRKYDFENYLNIADLRGRMLCNTGE